MKPKVVLPKLAPMNHLEFKILYNLNFLESFVILKQTFWHVSMLGTLNPLNIIHLANCNEIFFNFHDGHPDAK
jgi:hypothetical protein